MKIFKWILAIMGLTFLGLYYINSEAKKKREATELAESGYEIMKSYYDNGKLKADAETIKGVKNGKAHNYYSDGSVQSSFTYKNGLKHGDATWYHTNGKPYRITPYVNNKKEGIQTKFYKTGELLAEIPYKNNTLQVGTKEFNENGNLLENYPSIVYLEHKNDFTKNQRYVDFSLSDKSAKVKFELKHINNNKSALPKLAPTNNNAFRLVIPASYAGKELTLGVDAVFTTKLNNKKKLTKEVKL